MTFSGRVIGGPTLALASVDGTAAIILASAIAIVIVLDRLPKSGKEMLGLVDAVDCWIRSRRKRGASTSDDEISKSD